MIPKRFVAANARVALKQVRAELGMDAVILSNRSIAEGAEIVAVSMADIEPLTASAASFTTAATTQATTTVMPASPMPHAPSPTMLAPMPQYNAPPLRHALRTTPSLSVANPSSGTWRTPVAAAEVSAQSAPAQGGFDPQAARAQEATMLAEIRAMKSMLSEQVSSFNWSETLRLRPLRGRMLRTLLDSGFSVSLARSVVEHMPDDYSPDSARHWVIQVLARNLLTSAAGDLTDRGGVYALVGPTGVGKTTTTAKLAARCVMKHGPSRLGLVMTDDYRVGAQDQLRIYGRLLGVPVYVAQTPDDLKQALAAMGDKHLVLIDTVGMSQNDERVAAQHDLLISAGVQRLLLLNATAQAETLEQVAKVYCTHQNRAAPVAGAILTKLDEAARPGCALDVIIRRKLALHFCSSGQRVPEDLELANPVALARLSLQKDIAAGGSPIFSLGDNEAGLFMTRPQSLSHPEHLIEVRT